MSHRTLWFCCLCLAAAVGCAHESAYWHTAQTPVQWGDPVGGLEIGIAGESATPPPDRPQTPPGNPYGARVYFRNVSEDPITIVDPTNTVLGGPAGNISVLRIVTDPATVTRVSLNRPNSPRVVTLIPSQTISVSIDLPQPILESNQPYSLVAQFENDDSVITILPPSGAKPAQTVQNVWTGTATSGDLPLVQE